MKISSQRVLLRPLPFVTVVLLLLPSAQASVNFQLPRDFFVPGILFENYATGSAIPMTSTGAMNVTNGSTTSTGPGYTSANFYPYIMLDQARNYMIMHPGVNSSANRGAS